MNINTLTAWSRKRIWIKISHFIDRSTMQLPLTFLLLPLLLCDWHWVAITPFTILMDFIIHATLFTHQHFYSYKRLKESMSKCLKGNLTIINTPLIEQFTDVVKKTFKKSIILCLFSPDIRVIQSDKLKYKFTTIPDLTGKSIVVVRKRFDENEIRDIVLLAHEFGHITHSLLRYERYIIPTIVAIYQFILLVYAILYGTWGLFFSLLPINGFLFWKNVNEFESRIEINADTLALQYIETLCNTQSMHMAASYLIRLRIESSTKLKRGLSQFSVNNCIFVLSHFVLPDERGFLINASNERSRLFENDDTLDHKTKVDKLSNEILIRHNLQDAIIRDSALYPPLTMDSRSGFSIILYTLSLFSVLFAISKLFKNIDYHWGWKPLIVIPILFIIFLLFFRTLNFIIWNKKAKLQSQIGL